MFRTLRSISFFALAGAVVAGGVFGTPDAVHSVTTIGAGVGLLVGMFFTALDASA